MLLNARVLALEIEVWLVESLLEIRMLHRLRLFLALALVVSGVVVTAVGIATIRTPDDGAAAQNVLRGVNLAGAEFGPHKLPGTYGIDYTYPSASQLDYYQAKGVKLIRLPFRWERLQHCLYCPLDTAELGRIQQFVAAAGARDMMVILNAHNYARYNGHLIGTNQVPNDAFGDFWRRLAWHFRGDSNIWAYGLMNEPHDTNGLWPAAAQAGVDGVRLVDWGHTILVSGDGWSGAWTWQQNNANLSVQDPANNFMYEAHQYFDSDGSGTYGSGYDANGAYTEIGVDRVKPFVDWLAARGAKGFIGEYGVPDNDARWLPVMASFLNYLDANGIASTYWAGGPWWGDYPLSIEPRNGADRPQMDVLTGAVQQTDPISAEPDPTEPVPTQPVEEPAEPEDPQDIDEEFETPVVEVPAGETPQPEVAEPVPTESESTPTAPVEVGAKSLVLYDDGFRNGFVDGTFNADWRNACHEALVVTAPCSYAVSFGPWGGINFMAPGYHLDTGEFASLEFFIHTGGQDLTSFSVLMTAAGNGAILREVKLGSSHVQETLSNGYARIQVPISALNAENVAVATIQIKNGTNQHRDPVHIDEVRLLLNP